MIEAKALEDRIRQELGDVSLVQATDLTGTQDHWQVVIVADAFAGKTRIQQHQMVYAALGELMAGPIHALALKTYTPESWSEAKG
jgi:stress-induced morphogen